MCIRDRRRVHGDEVLSYFLRDDKISYNVMRLKLSFLFIFWLEVHLVFLFDLISSILYPYFFPFQQHCKVAYYFVYVQTGSLKNACSPLNLLGSIDCMYIIFSMFSGLILSLIHI
eukprot:TRINITY_DN31542_c0_g1_i1.p1 TRINITY_DN31542_c0_g1~~TRINITY_DN31542_c0_g1_i1.p1  ORF type:complete len:134 (+),score=18.36 TRINITY_DN31542_c0_g1_i1:60-404(+)